MQTLELHEDDRWGVEWRCGAFDSGQGPSVAFCNLERYHDIETLPSYVRIEDCAVWHADVRKGALWAGWRGPFNYDQRNGIVPKYYK